MFNDSIKKTRPRERLSEQQRIDVEQCLVDSSKRINTVCDQTHSQRRLVLTQCLLSTPELSHQDKYDSALDPVIKYLFWFSHQQNIATEYVDLCVGVVLPPILESCDSTTYTGKGLYDTPQTLQQELDEYSVIASPLGSRINLR